MLDQSVVDYIEERCRALPLESHKKEIRRFIQSNGKLTDIKREIQREHTILGALPQGPDIGQKWRNEKAASLPCSAFRHLFAAINTTIKTPDSTSALKRSYIVNCYISSFKDRLDPFLNTLRYFNSIKLEIKTQKKNQNTVIHSEGMQNETIVNAFNEAYSGLDVSDDNQILERAKLLVARCANVCNIEAVIYTCSPNLTPLFIPVYSKGDKSIKDFSFVEREKQGFVAKYLLPQLANDPNDEMENEIIENDAEEEIPEPFETFLSSSENEFADIQFGFN